ncbi:MAG: DUF898 domain-containing protein [Deltaproteobacteria bacterium]|nr:DUF898 domain-containing protein [Deltaproteobacteria bacterium]MBW2360018.1 DUF898 domain-containing protein [Deltaproteobacteria bacterium]
MTQETTQAASRGSIRDEHGFEFRGTADEYFRIWIVNVCLTIVTLGIYSPWAKVRTGRYFAASTRLAGASFSYLADPIAILKGRLIVLGSLGLYALTPLVSPFLQPVLGVALAAAVPWAITRSLSFKAHNTAWRNIRFAFGARYGEAFAAYIGFPLAGVLTLGVLYPYAVFRQRQFIVDHAAFGTTRFAFASTSAAFYRVFGMLLTFALACVALVAALVAAGGEETGPALALGTLAPCYFGAFAYVAARITNLTYEGTKLGEHRLSSRVPALGLAWIYMSNALAILLSLGLLIPWSHVRLARFRLAHMSLFSTGSLEEFAATQGGDVSSLGAEFGEAFDIDVGL